MLYNREATNYIMKEGYVMNTNRFKYPLFAGLITALAFFIIYFMSIRFVLKNPIVTQNIIAFVILAIILGGISFLLFLFKKKIAFIIYIIGMIVGLFAMISAFWGGSVGFNDLAGLMSFFVFLILGLGVGLLAQLIYILVKKSK